MAKLWLPGDSDFALALREPNLLVPGRKPIGPVEIDVSHKCSDVLFSTLFTPPTGPQLLGRVAADPPALVFKGDRASRASTSANYAGFSWPGPDATILIRTNSPVVGNNYVAQFNSYSPGLTNSSVYSGMYFSGSGAWGDILPNNAEIVTIVWRFKYNGGTSWDANCWANGIKSVQTVNANFALDGKTFQLLGGFSKPTTDEFFVAHGWDRALSDADIDALSADPYAIYRPANSTPFLIGLPGGGGAVAITVPQGNLTLSTVAPTVSVTASASIEVPQADLVLNTTAPTVSVSDHVEITVPQADLTLSTTAPTVQAGANVSVEVPQADLSLSSEPPAVTTTDHVEISPPAADLSLSSIAPTIAVSEDGAIIVPTAQLLLSAQAPTVELSNNVEITVPQGDLSLSTTAPQVGISWNIEVPQGALLLSSTAPSVLQGFNILVPGADLTLSPTAPTVATTAAVGITVPQGDLVLEGFAPTVEATGVDIWTQVGAVSTSWTEITSSSTVWTEI